MKNLASLIKIIYSYSKGVLQKNTGIPASVLNKFLIGKNKLSSISIQKLINFHKTNLKSLKRQQRKKQYKEARECGLSSKEACSVRSLSSIRSSNYIKLRAVGTLPEYALKQSLLPPEKIDIIINRMIKIATQLSKKHNVKIKYIFEGMSKNSYRTVDDWEIYVKEKKTK
jgi:hypothetical protein